MKKALIIIGAILVCLCLVFIWQRDNIKAGLLGLKYSSDDLDEQLNSNQERIDRAIDDNPEVKLKPLTDEENQRLQDGTLSEQEAIDIMLGAADEAEHSGEAANAAPDEAKPSAEPSGTPSTEPSAPAEETAAGSTASPKPSEADDTDAKISELVATFYVMKTSYIAKLSEIETTVIETYKALPAEKRTASKKASMALDCINQATALEKECDGRMEYLLGELKKLLIKAGRDESLVTEIKAVYAEEKALRKAYYINSYL